MLGAFACDSGLQADWLAISCPREELSIAARADDVLLLHQERLERLDRRVKLVALSAGLWLWAGARALFPHARSEAGVEAAVLRSDHTQAKLLAGSAKAPLPQVAVCACGGRAGG